MRRQETTHNQNGGASQICALTGGQGPVALFVVSEQILFNGMRNLLSGA
jgi:hypothetical protein